MKMLVNVMENNFRNVAIQWQISKHIKAVICFTLPLTIPAITTFEILNLEKTGNGRGVQPLQWRHSMVNKIIYKSRIEYCCASSHH